MKGKGKREEGKGEERREEGIGKERQGGKERKGKGKIEKWGREGMQVSGNFIHLYLPSNQKA